MMWGWRQPKKDPFDLNVDINGDIISISYNEVHSIEVKPTEEMLELFREERERGARQMRDIIEKWRYGDN